MIKLGLLLQHIAFGRTVVLVEHMIEKEIVTLTLTEELEYTKEYEKVEPHLGRDIMNISTRPAGGLYIEII